MRKLRKIWLKKRKIKRNRYNRGSQTISSPLAFAEGLFSFYNFYKKEGFLKDLS
jgi:hypothetical protein